MVKNKKQTNLLIPRSVRNRDDTHTTPFSKEHKSLPVSKSSATRAQRPSSVSETMTPREAPGTPAGKHPQDTYSILMAKVKRPRTFRPSRYSDPPLTTLALLSHHSRSVLSKRKEIQHRNVSYTHACVRFLVFSNSHI